MATKITGLGANFYIAGFDLSADVSALDNVAGSIKPLDVTAIQSLAHERLGGVREGMLDFSLFFDVAAGQEHAALSGLPTADAIASAFLANAAFAQAIGNPACSINAKQLSYDWTRGTDGSLTGKVNTQSNGFGLEWGEALTAGKRTDAVATNGAAQDDGNGFTTPGVPASGTPVTNTSPLPATVVVSGGTGTNVTINGVAQGTFDGTYTVPAGQTISLTYTVAPTWTWTLQTAWGAQAYLQVTAFTGTSVDIQVQHSPDNTTWSTLIDFGAQSAIGGLRGSVSNVTTVNRYLRAITGTGTFSSVTFAVMLARNLVSGVTF